MFLGKAVHTIDEKGRLVLPAFVRRSLEGAEKCIIAPARDGSLTVFRPEDFTREADQMMAAATNPRGRRLLRMFTSTAHEQKVDKSGRILINEVLRQFAGISIPSEVVVNGYYRAAEIWNMARFEQNEAKATGEYIETDDEEDTTA
ncbi:MAG: division/cell wall cluster transcriptional repressor MraZ [Actinomycetota bacterium]